MGDGGGEGEELVERGQPDDWANYLPGRDWVPAYLVSPYAAQYRTVVEILLEAQEASLIGVSYDDVAARVPRYLVARLRPEDVEALTGGDFNLDARLQQLVKWNVLTRWQEAARTGEDFLRRRDRYQLTPAAARLHVFWTQDPGGDEDAAADLTLAPRAIHDRLEMFEDAVRQRRYPAAAAEYQQVIALHQGMAVAARAWQRSLAHALSGGPDPDKQEVLWRTLESYVAMWGEQVDVHTPRIAVLIDELASVLDDGVWRACVRAALSEDVPDEVVATQAERWARTWKALTNWFSGATGQARRLRRQLRDLVAPWARNMNVLMDTGGAVTRRAELLRLAQAIERAPDEESAWRMWDTATTLFSARHLMLPADAPDEHTLPWADAPAAPVTARFREQGVRAAVGRKPSVPDYSADRAAARRARAASLAARADAEATLRNRSGTCLADWGSVSDEELDVLLALLGIARAPAGDPSATRTAVTGDGRWRVSLTPPGDDDSAAAVLHSPRGRFTTVNWLFRLDPAR